MSLLCGPEAQNVPHHAGAPLTSGHAACTGPEKETGLTQCASISLYEVTVCISPLT